MSIVRIVNTRQDMVCATRSALLLAAAVVFMLIAAYTPSQHHGPASGGTTGTARYPVHTGGAYVSRYPEPIDEFNVPPSLEQLNKQRVYDFSPATGLHLDGFTLWALNDFGEHLPEMQEHIRLSGKDLLNGDYHLIVHMKDAPALTDLFFYVRYHSERYSPRDVMPGSAFGFDGDRLWLHKLSVPGVIAAGMTRIRPDKNGGTIVTDGVVFELIFEDKPMDVIEWWIDRAPNHAHNKPHDVTAYFNPDDCTIVLFWREVNLGDYNNDGEVGITDLIPVGRRYGRVSTDGDEDDWDQMVDGESDGEVNYRDAWPIRHNYGALLQGYRVYRRPAKSPRKDEVLLPHRTSPLLPMSIHRPTSWDPVRVNEYRFIDSSIETGTRPEEWIYRIVPYNAASDVEGDGSDVEITLSVTTNGIVVRSLE